MILNQFIYPASHVANPGNTNAAIEPPMGARFRLKASVEHLDAQSRVADHRRGHEGLWHDRGRQRQQLLLLRRQHAVDGNNQYALTWNDNDIQDSVHGLKSLHYSDFEVVDLTPVVTGLSATQRPGWNAGDGQREELLRARPAVSRCSSAIRRPRPLRSSTTATCWPSRRPERARSTCGVQSGVSDPNDSSNIKSPIFGYGMSAVSAADRFSYAAPIPGDANLDGKVDFADLGVVIGNYAMTGAHWTNGDFNSDGKVDFADLGIVIGNYGQSSSAGLSPQVVTTQDDVLQCDGSQPADSATVANTVSGVPGGPVAAQPLGAIKTTRATR